MPEYEITIGRPNGDWPFWRGEFADFHDACKDGLQSAKSTGLRLISVTKIPEGTLSMAEYLEREKQRAADARKALEEKKEG